MGRWFAISDQAAREFLTERGTLRGEHLREKHRLAGKNGGLDQESSSRGSEEKTDSFFFFSK